MAATTNITRALRSPVPLLKTSIGTSAPCPFRVFKVLASAIRTEMPVQPSLQIGDWWVDPAANEIGRAGETVRIEPKAMQVLIALADVPGRVVSRESFYRRYGKTAVTQGDSICIIRV